ncbi:MAG: DUF2064 domain-containing protein [Rhodospirillaceae bacterium]|nr:DUF2064 domain-containing protein [Rhodospirillaceae bacterium]MCY4238322.1 DUF2064 domain-containing protein [Rhodospirillaceae bacterium]
MATRRPVVILFLKAPVIGAAKRRLVADIGAVAAWRFYRQTVQRVGGDLCRCPVWDSVLAIAPNRSSRQAKAGFPMLKHLQYQEQGQGNIGIRMARCLDRYAPRPRLLIGGDIPDVTTEIVREAFAKLACADLIFGPAEDGGFWVIGQRGPARVGCLFANVAWSGSQTLSATLANVPRIRQVAFASMLMDIDTGRALAAWRQSKG